MSASAPPPPSRTSAEGALPRQSRLRPGGGWRRSQGLNVIYGECPVSVRRVSGASLVRVWY